MELKHVLSDSVDACGFDDGENPHLGVQSSKFGVWSRHHSVPVLGGIGSSIDDSPRCAQERAERRATNYRGCVVRKSPIPGAGKSSDQRARLAPITPVTEHAGCLGRANREYVAQQISQPGRTSRLDFARIFQKRFDWPRAIQVLAQSGSFAMKLYERLEIERDCLIQQHLKPEKGIFTKRALLSIVKAAPLANDFGAPQG